ncbi:oligosaccharide flippase family protein [Winogradskyella sp. A2]|uniref:oligosaccharide flippase family protein n=1 Tax=Winogradskyella sp. A2 TaxID=3366944 RepID=UPI00398C685C
MFKSNNNSIQTFWVALGSLSAFGLAIVSSAILSRYLDKQEYGTYRQVIYVYTMLLVIFSAGLPKIFAFYLPRYSLSEGKAIVKKVSLVLIVCGLVFSFFLYFFAGIIAAILGNNELERALQIFSPVPVLLLPTLGIEGIFSTYKKSVYIAIYNTVTRIIMLLFIVVPVVIFESSYIHALYGWIIASVFTLVLAFIFKGIPFKGIKNVKTDLRLKQILAYSLPLVMASLWGVAIKSSDSFYISRYFGAEVFAEYANGFIDLPFVSMITSSIAVILTPIFSKQIHENSDKNLLLKSWRKTIERSAILIYPLIIYFIIFSEDIIVFLFSNKYVNSSYYFRINLVFNFFNIIVFVPLFLATGRTKLYAKVHMFLAVIIWVTGYLVIILFNSPIAIAINSTIINIFKILIFVYLGSKILNIRFLSFFPFRKMGLSFLQSVLIMFPIYILESYLIDIEQGIIKISVTFIMFCSLILVTSSIFKIDYYSIIRPFFKKNKFLG